MITVTMAFSRTKSYFYVYYVLRIFTGMVCEGSVLCLALAYVVNDLKTPFSFFTFCRLLWNVYIFQRKDIELWPAVIWLGPWFQVHGLIEMWIFGQRTTHFGRAELSLTVTFTDSFEVIYSVPSKPSQLREVKKHSLKSSWSGIGLGQAQSAATPN